MPILVPELAIDAVGAVAGRKEGLAVLIFPHNCGFVSEFLSTVGKLALFFVAAVAVLAVRFAEFSLVQVLDVIARGSIGSQCQSSFEAHWVGVDLGVEFGRLSWAEREGGSVNVHLVIRGF